MQAVGVGHSANHEAHATAGEDIDGGRHVESVQKDLILLPDCPNIDTSARLGSPTQGFLSILHDLECDSLDCVAFETKRLQTI